MSAPNSKSFRAGVVQLRSTESIDDNLEESVRLVRAAAADGAEVVALPENFAFLALDSATRHPGMSLDGREVQTMRSLAQELGVHLLLGSISEASPDPDRCWNTAVWIERDGESAATYRKIHLFDIDIPGAESHRESDRILAGREAVTVDTELGRFGLSICYDLRFPELYRELIDQGATLLCVPAAFTLTTGRDHWLPLLRARAIENQCHVLAPGQWGHHGGRRRSFGHSCILDPWGTVLAEVPDGPGYAVARIDDARTQRVRTQLPALKHRRHGVIQETPCTRD